MENKKEILSRLHKEGHITIDELLEIAKDGESQKEYVVVPFDPSNPPVQNNWPINKPYIYDPWVFPYTTSTVRLDSLPPHTITYTN